MTPDSLTTRSADGLIHTYALTPSTTAITGTAHNGSPAASFTVNDEVMVVGTRQGGTVIATAVAHTSAVGPQGRPMDFGV